MEQLLVAVSVHREPADRNAILFQLGEHEWTAARAADQYGPTPPYQEPPDLAELIASCAAASLLSPASAAADPVAPDDAWIVDARLAAELHRQLEAASRRAELIKAHRRAAEYWQWRSTAWPQERRQDLHDLLEARYHLFCAGDANEASEVTSVVCAQLHAWGDLSQEAELIRSTLEVLPDGSAGSAAWMHKLGAVHQLRGEHEQARRCYYAAGDTFAAVSDYHGVARSQHSLGVLAQAQGEYRRAERHYRRSGAAEKKADALARTDATEPESADEPEQSPRAPRAPQPDPAKLACPPGDPIRPPATRHRAAKPRSGRQLAPAAAALSVSDDASSLALRLRSRTGRLLGIFGLITALIAILAATLARPGVRTHVPPGALSPAAVRLAAAAWVASQVNASAVVGCDPAMCAALAQRGVPRGDLLALGSGGAFDPLASNVIVATAALRAEFGARLTTAYAPEVLATFGQGASEIQVCAVAPDGVPAFEAALLGDLQARRQFGASLLRNKDLLVAARARHQLSVGSVDSRLLAVLATVADLQPLRVFGFSDAGPGAGTGVPLRSAVIGPTTANGEGWDRAVLAFLAAQQVPFRPAAVRRITLRGSAFALRIQYLSPSPLGLLTTPGASQQDTSTH